MVFGPSARNPAPSEIDIALQGSALSGKSDLSVDDDKCGEPPTLFGVEPPKPRMAAAICLL
jgi:hypothetical protein